MDEWLQDLDLFDKPEHQAYAWEHPRTDTDAQIRPGALLIHGFPGTPMETRALGAHLHGHGWSVRAPLLPGFGPEIGTLFERDYEAWIAEAETTLRELQAQHNPTLIIGHSMGGAIALNVAARLKPEGLVLLAPFWRLPFNSPLVRALSPILRVFIRRTRPFRSLDLTSSEMQADMEAYLPDVDLDDPEVRQRIRNITVPTRVFEQLEALGNEAYDAAERVTTPTLILQGIEDELVNRTLTRKILTKISGPVEYHEIHAEHNLLMDEAPGWNRVKAHVQTFASRLLEPAERNTP
jgi:esterase/lipase